eukprot:1842168-Amphidinium_carterae.2
MSGSKCPPPAASPQAVGLASQLQDLRHERLGSVVPRHPNWQHGVWSHLAGRFLSECGAELVDGHVACRLLGVLDLLGVQDVCVSADIRPVFHEGL